MGDRYGETESRVLSRECDVVSVPWGRHETLPEGSYALITQRLGSSITVMSGGNLYRIAERDADALGLGCMVNASAYMHCPLKEHYAQNPKPAPRALELLRAMEDAGIAPKRVRTVHGVAGRPPKLVLVDGVRGAGAGLHWMEPLVLRGADGEQTPEYRRIYGETE